MTGVLSVILKCTFRRTMAGGGPGGPSWRNTCIAVRGHVTMLVDPSQILCETFRDKTGS